MESYDIKFYRNNTIVFNDNEEINDWTVELNVTGEQGQAIIHIDNDPDKGNSLQIGDAVVISACSSGTVFTDVFSGEVETVTKIRDEENVVLEVTAFDWSKLLSEHTIDLSYPTVTNVSTIALGIIDLVSVGTIPLKNERKISTISHVGTVDKTRTIDFIGLTMNEALKKLSDYTYCDFYVDSNKEFNWFGRGTRVSTSLGDTELTYYNYDQTRDILNSVKVYGAENAPYPIADVDTLSDSLDGWEYSVGSGPSSTFNLTLTPTTFTAYRNNWTKAQKHPSLTLIPDEFESSGTNRGWTGNPLGSSPWLNNSTLDFIYMYNYGGYSYEKCIADYWSFSDLSDGYENKNCTLFCNTLALGGYQWTDPGDPGTIRAQLWNSDLESWLTVGDYIFPYSALEVATEIRIDVSTFLTDYETMNNARLRLVSDSPNFDLEVYYAKIITSFTCDNGAGQPYVNIDDVDSYITSPSPSAIGTEYDQEYSKWGLIASTSEFAWNDTYIISDMSISFKCRLNALSGSVFLQPEIRSTKKGGGTLNSGSYDPNDTWYDLEPIEVLSGGWATYTVEKTSSGTYLEDIFEMGSDLVDFELRFKTAIGSSDTVSITYTTINIMGTQVTSAITLLTGVKKAGLYSLYFLHYPQNEPSSLEIWGKRTLPETIACQSVENKEGFRELVWASYHNASVGSGNAHNHWELPNAKVTYNVYLGDNVGNTIVYAAGGIIQEKTISPRPAQTYPDSLTELRLGVGEDAEATGKWAYVSPATSFDWTKVNDIKFSFTSNVTEVANSSVDPYISGGQLILDWVHFEGGKWYSEYELSDLDAYVVKYGRSYGEFHDDTIFSTLDAYYKAKYLVERYKKPVDIITDCEVDYEGMEGSLEIGGICTFDIPELTTPGSFRVTKLRWIWDSDLVAQLEVEEYP